MLNAVQAKDMVVVFSEVSHQMRGMFRNMLFTDLDAVACVSEVECCAEWVDSVVIASRDRRGWGGRYG